MLRSFWNAVPKPIRVLLRILVIAGVTLIGGLYLMQDGMIYHPAPYTSDPRSLLPPGGEQLTFSTPEGTQHAYLIRNGQQPVRRLWVMFHGNASLALDWLDLISGAPDPRDAFLLVEYPGYGGGEGDPSQKAIAENSDGALKAAYERLQKDQPTELGVIGYSLGAAAALEFATRHAPRKIILLAPFTSIAEMSERVVGKGFHWLVRHPFDNSARLEDLAKSPSPPPTVIFHGTDDILIPPDMGRRLAAAHPKFVRFHPVPKASHPDVVDAARAEILQEMR